MHTSLDQSSLNSGLSTGVAGIPVSKSSSIPNEGYNYLDEGPAPDDLPTGRPVQRSATGLSEELEALTRQTPYHRLQGIALRIFKRNIDGGWRAQLHTKKFAPPPSLGTTAQQQPAEPQVTQPTSAQQQLIVSDWEVLRNWCQTELNGEEDVHPKIIIASRGPPLPTEEPREKRGNIRWIHEYKHVLNLLEFENLIIDRAGNSLAPGVQGLTKRLLKRIRTSDERGHEGGKFLIPTAVRYDGQSKISTEPEKPCTFFIFPYFWVDKHRGGTCPGCTGAGESDHRLRSLLKLRYRLENTEIKDSCQCITQLSPAGFEEHVPPKSKWRDTPLSKSHMPIIHVPQLWVASITEDLLCTSAPLTEKALFGSGIKTQRISRDGRTASEAPPLVRIIFDHSGKTQWLTYPTEHCNWFFGLLNKQRLILRYMEKLDNDPAKNGKASGADQMLANRAGSGTVPTKPYIFSLSEDSNPNNHVTIRNWRQILKDAAERDRLDIWLKPKSNAPGINVTSSASTSPPRSPKVASTKLAVPLATPSGTVGSLSSATLSALSDSAAASSFSRERSANSPNARSRATSIEKISIEPFLSWPIIDDFGAKDKSHPRARVQQILDRVYTNFCTEYVDLLPVLFDERQLADSNAPGAAPSLEKTFPNDCHPDDIAKNLDASKGELDDQIIQAYVDFLDWSQCVFQLYVPESEPPKVSSLTQADHLIQQSESIHASRDFPSAVYLYWTLVKAIIETATPVIGSDSDINALVGNLKEVHRFAEEVHIGTDAQATSTCLGYSSSSSANKVLLETTVESLQHVFNILAEALKHFRSCSQSQFKHEMHAHTDKVAKKAICALEKAKNQLIVEADDLLHEKGLGSVVTPEAILIMLLERLSTGVYKDDKIDVLDMYEKIVEDIALKLDSEKGASRRLLLNINKLTEELDIVHDVLHQQRSILKMFGESLDPDTFDSKSVPRMMSYDIESKCINKILKEIQGRITDCSELIQRARHLAEQNVQLVETQQDDNSKAIMVFTIVTVTFLPPSFVSSYFGMNLNGISNTTSRPAHYWEVSIPLTIAVVASCLMVVYFSSLKRKWKMWMENRASHRKS